MIDVIDYRAGNSPSVIYALERLSDGFVLVDVSEFTEGELPRRLARVTMRRT